MNDFFLGKGSLANLEGVDTDIVETVRLAIKLSEIDFSVVDGLRTLDEQKELVAEGKSWTLDSYHLTGNAVDIYPWVSGRTSHKAKHYKLIAKAMFKASQMLRMELEWGGLWNTEDKPHWQKVA
jgi:peptidoglycan L-alanyl-D-glutamate endopeptidase CwlK